MRVECVSRIEFKFNPGCQSLLGLIKRRERRFLLASQRKVAVLIVELTELFNSDIELGLDPQDELLLFVVIRHFCAHAVQVDLEVLFGDAFIGHGAILRISRFQELVFKQRVG